LQGLPGANPVWGILYHVTKSGERFLAKYITEHGLVITGDNQKRMSRVTVDVRRSMPRNTYGARRCSWRVMAFEEFGARSRPALNRIARLTSPANQAKIYIRRWVSGQVQHPRSNNMKRLACALITLLVIIGTPGMMAMTRSDGTGPGSADDGPVPAETRQPDIDVDVPIDPLLRERLESAAPGEMLEVTIQFREDLRDGDIRRMEELDFEIVTRLTVIPAVLARGTPGAIRALAGYGRTYWMEYNERLTPALHETTTVIGATDVWNRAIENRHGEIEEFPRNEQSYLYGIDGSGVTVAVVDTGIDGGHPDFDYGEKMIVNLHKNGADDPWVENENSDTSYGHGTHCAGIVAGNGDASGGQRRGVAPGANLIGLGGDWVPFPDESPVRWAVLEGLEWVYDHSRPGANTYNIRVVSNSWGGAGDLDPQDSVHQICNKLVYENNVVVVFAAMNSGRDSPEGAEDTTSQQSKTPGVLSVAAAWHDGRGIADFSSRGKRDDTLTYPDVAAPGVDIWATTPRGTWLDIYQRQDEDMYYMAISGTSMATPHVAGVVALMFQACPSLGLSKYHGENTRTGSVFYDGWKSDPETLIHDAEYILKMTADRIEPVAGNGIPEKTGDFEHSGIHGRYFDYVQGYGLVNVTRAIAVCLALEELRRDDPGATADDALDTYGRLYDEVEVARETDRLTTAWRGEWAHLTYGTNPLDTFNTDNRHRVYIPEEAEHLVLDLSYTPMSNDHFTIGTIDVTLDYDGNGANDWDLQLLDYDGSKRYELDLADDTAAGQHKGKYWTFGITGNGFQFLPDQPDDEFLEATIEFGIELTLDMDMSGGEVVIDGSHLYSDMSPFRHGEPSPGYDGGELSIERDSFDLGRAEKDDGDFPVLYAVIAGAAAVGVMVLWLVFGGGLVLLKRRPGKKDPGKGDMRGDAVPAAIPAEGTVDGEGPRPEDDAVPLEDDAGEPWEDV